MRKSDKKVENKLRVALTEVCESALKQYTGFEWLTHQVNYNAFPQSLKVVCVFDTNINLSRFLKSNYCHEFTELISKNLSSKEININNIAKHIIYDTEEECKKKNDGKWSSRLH